VGKLCSVENSQNIKIGVIGTILPPSQPSPLKGEGVLKSPPLLRGRVREGVR